MANNNCLKDMQNDIKKPSELGDHWDFEYTIHLEHFEYTLIEISINVNELIWGWQN